MGQVQLCEGPGDGQAGGASQIAGGMGEDRRPQPSHHFSDDLWDAVKARQAAVTRDMSKAEGDSKGHALARANRPRHMVSGLLFCGSCGSPYILVGKDYYGCNRHRSKGTCGNGLKVRLGNIEGRVVDALRHWLLQPDVLAEGVANIRELIARVGAEAGKETATLRRKLASLDGQVSNVVDAIATGMRSPALTAKLAALEAEAETVRAAMAQATAPMPKVPDAAALAEAYRLVVDNLMTLGGGARMTEVVRRIVTRVTLTPEPDGSGLKAKMQGSLTRAVDLLQGLENKQPADGSAGCSMAVVAGVGNRLNLLWQAMDITNPHNPLIFHTKDETEVTQSQKPTRRAPEKKPRSVVGAKHRKASDRMVPPCP